MEFKRTGGLVEIGDSIRVEAGPRMVTETATKKLIEQLAEQASNVAVAPPDGVEAPEPQLLDSAGNPVQAGQEIQRLDWRAFSEGRPGGTVYYLYRLRERAEDEPHGHSDTHVWGEEGEIGR